MKATVQIGRVDPMHLGPLDVECAVRLGIQGYGSVEIEVTPLGLGVFPPTPNLHFRYETLEAVLDNPKVLGVTFRGPWTESIDDRLPPGAILADRKPIVR